MCSFISITMAPMIDPNFTRQTHTPLEIPPQLQTHTMLEETQSRAYRKGSLCFHTLERLFAWLHNFRRIVTRYDYYALNYLGFVQLGCLIILLRQF